MARPLERRRSHRENISAFVAIETGGRAPYADQGLGTACDLSGAGARVRLNRAPKVGQRVRVRLAIGEEIHQFEAVVTRSDECGKGQYDVGLDWSLCSPKEQAFLSEFIRLRRAQA